MVGLNPGVSRSELHRVPRSCHRRNPQEPCSAAAAAGKHPWLNGRLFHENIPAAPLCPRPESPCSLFPQLGSPRSGFRHAVAAVLRLISFSLAFSSLTHAAEPITVFGRAMGTTWSAKWIPEQALADPVAVQRELAGVLERLEGIFSTYRPESEISRFNRTGATEWFPVSLELAAAAAYARALSALTGGAFDVTVEPLLQRWGFGPHPRRPALQETRK